MRNKKDERPAELTPEQQLEAKVDAMMDVSAKKSAAPELQSPEGSALKAKDELPPLDIFSDPSTAPDVPKDLLKQLDKSDVSEAAAKPQAAEEPRPTNAQTKTADADALLDDAATDAAIDDIVAYESNDTLATEDAEQREAASVTQPAEKVRKIHHHPIFWTIIFLLCVVALVAGYLLITGGSNLPGSSLINKLSNH